MGNLLKSLVRESQKQTILCRLGCVVTARMASRVSICFVVFVVCLFAPSLTRIGAEDSESKEFVLTLDHSNFSETVSKHDFIVVEFYAPWYYNHPILMLLSTNLTLSIQFWKFGSGLKVEGLSVWGMRNCWWL